MFLLLKYRINFLFLRLVATFSVPIEHTSLEHTTLFAVWPVFFKVYGAQESIPRNELRQPM
jgi:hypothetical protein